jgi:hypothetical protein
MRKTTPALVATTLITSYLLIAMLLVGRDALSTPHTSAAAFSQRQTQTQLASVRP